MSEQFWSFAGVHPYLTVFTVLVLAGMVASALTWPLRLVNRWIRHRNIVAAGWPPAHLDADGDLREP